MQRQLRDKSVMSACGDRDKLVRDLEVKRSKVKVTTRSNKVNKGGDIRIDGSPLSSIPIACRGHFIPHDSLFFDLVIMILQL